MQETRHYDVGAKRTSTLRSKEEAHDYRYFPEPDMVPFEFTDEFIESIRGAPARAARCAQRSASWPTSGCPRTTRRCSRATSSSPTSSRRPSRIAGAERAKAISNVMLNDLSALPERRGHRASTDSRIVPSMVAELVGLVEDGTISGKQAKEVFAEMAATGDAPGAIVELKGMKQVSDTGAIEEIVDRVSRPTRARSRATVAARPGSSASSSVQVMRETGGQANPAGRQRGAQAQARGVGGQSRRQPSG